MVHHMRDTDQKKRSPVPDDLTSWDRWACRNKKRPVHPVKGHPIKWKEPGPHNRLSFEQAVAAAEEHGHDGVGFFLTPDDPFTVYDFDGCGDRETGYVHPAVLDALDLLGNPYSEWSPSGRGIRAVVRATKPEGGCATKDTPWGDSFEMYDRARFFTVTGDVFNSGGVPDAQRAVEDVYGRFLARPLPAGPRGLSEAGKAVSGQHAGLPDDGVKGKARNCPKTGTRFAYLYDSGGGLPVGERSEADMFVVGRLVYWTNRDPEQAKRLFRESDLVRGKYADAGQGEGYLDRTVSRAMEECREGYDPDYGERMKRKAKDAVAAHVEKLYESGLAGGRRDVMLMMLDTAANHGTYRDGYVDFNDNQTRIADALGIDQTYVSKLVRALISEGRLIRTSVGRQGKNSYYRLPKLESPTMYVGEPTKSPTMYATHVYEHSRTTTPTEPRPKTGPEITAAFRTSEHHALGCGCDLCSVRTPSYATYADVTHLDVYRRTRGAA